MERLDASDYDTDNMQTIRKFFFHEIKAGSKPRTEEPV